MFALGCFLVSIFTKEKSSALWNRPIYKHLKDNLEVANRYTSRNHIPKQRLKL
jgi:hypothetical protein